LPGKATTDDFVRRVLSLRARRLTHCLSQEETTLLQRINDGPSPDVLRRRQELIARRDARVISPEELAELIRLTEQAERFDADRMAALIDLAGVRQTTLDQLMTDLGLLPLESRG